MMNEGNYVAIKRLYLLFGTVFLLLTAVPAHSHNLPLGGSKWCLRTNGLVARIDLNQGLLSDIRELKEGQYDLAAHSDTQLQQMAADILQPYLNKKLSVTVNGKTYPVKVDRLVRSESGFLYTIWLSVDRIGFSRPENSLKIDYRLLFDETNNTHLNLAFLYRSDAAGDALQKVFDLSQPEGQYNFENGSPVWELSVKGAAPEPVAAPAISANPPIGHTSLNKNRGNTAAQRVASALPAPDKRPVLPAKSDIIKQ